ncbi:MAG: hypothetical protein WCQ96_01505 [Patescibacteria group bacterium]
MKKLLFLFAFLFAFSANASTIPEGAIVKTANNPDVYIVKYNAGKQYKRLVLNPLVFKSYGHLKWENLLTISQSEMDSYTTSDLVRVDGYTAVYKLFPNGDNGDKYVLTSTDGYDLNSAYTINATDFGNYIYRGSIEDKISRTDTGNKTDAIYNSETQARLDRITKGAAIDKEISSIAKDINTELAELEIATRQTSSVSEYNAMAERYNYLLDKRERLAVIVKKIGDYMSYGTALPNIDRAYLILCGVDLQGM